MYALTYNKSDETIIAFILLIMDDNRSQPCCGRVAPSVSEDDTLNLSGDKDTILKQIDALHEQHRLQKLRELLDQSDYLRYADHDAKTKAICMLSVEDIILLLLPYNKNIPPELTFGEPYDSTFGAFVDKYQYSSYHVPEFLYLLLRYAGELPTFLVYAIQVNQSSIKLELMDQIVTKIWDKIPTLPRGTYLTFPWELQYALKEATLSRLDTVYIAVMLDQIGAFHPQCDLRIFVMSSKLHS